jgi:hypothetical protein
MYDFTIMDAGPFRLLWQELLSCKLLAIPVPAASIVLPGENIETLKTSFRNISPCRHPDFAPYLACTLPK